LIFRQHPENAIRRFRFICFHCSNIVIAKDRRIACINLDQIMQKQHLDHPIDIYTISGMLAQDQRVKRDVPAVFAGVLMTRAIA